MRQSLRSRHFSFGLRAECRAVGAGLVCCVRFPKSGFWGAGGLGLTQTIWVPHFRRGFYATKVGHRAKHDPSCQTRVIWTGVGFVVYGPVHTVGWQGSADDCRPYADQVGLVGQVGLSVYIRLHLQDPLALLRRHLLVNLFVKSFVIL